MEKINYRQAFQKNVQNYEHTTNSKYISLIFDLEKEVLDKFIDKLESRERSLMDFACGSGRWTQYLETKFKSSTGIDVSREMISFAKRKCKKTNFILTDLTSKNKNSRLNNKKFDVITAFRFYKNAEQKLREEATKNLKKYLKNDGYFIFDLHLNSWSFMGLLARFIRLIKLDELLNLNKLNVQTISLKDIKKLFKKDFEIIDYYGMGLLPSKSNYLILPKKLLYKVESFFTRNKILRGFSYNILVIAKRKL